MDFPKSSSSHLICKCHIINPIKDYPCLAQIVSPLINFPSELFYNAASTRLYRDENSTFAYCKTKSLHIPGHMRSCYFLYFQAWSRSEASTRSSLWNISLTVLFELYHLHGLFRRLAVLISILTCDSQAALKWHKNRKFSKHCFLSVPFQLKKVISHSSQYYYISKIRRF